MIGFFYLLDLWVIEIKKPTRCMILCVHSTLRSSEQSMNHRLCSMQREHAKGLFILYSK